MALVDLLKIKDLNHALEIIIIKEVGHDRSITERLKSEFMGKYKICVNDLSTLLEYKINSYDDWAQKYVTTKQYKK